MKKEDAASGVRDFLERIHAVMNAIDSLPLTTIAAVHGVAFGGGFELALVCDIIIADRMAVLLPSCGWADSGVRRNPRLKRIWGMQWCAICC